MFSEGTRSVSRTSWFNRAASKIRQKIENTQPDIDCFLPKCGIARYELFAKSEKVQFGVWRSNNRLGDAVCLFHIQRRYYRDGARWHHESVPHRPQVLHDGSTTRHLLRDSICSSNPKFKPKKGYNCSRTKHRFTSKSEKYYDVRRRIEFIPSSQPVWHSQFVSIKARKRSKSFEPRIF